MNLMLTSYQARILDDRPEDCLQQVIWEWVKGESLDITEDQLWQTIAEIKWRISCRLINVEELSRVQRMVLENCYNGSTWYAYHDSFMGPSSGREALIRSNVTRSMVALQQKMAAAGLDCPEPVLY